MNDVHASAAYRRHLVEVLVFDALMEARSRCTPD
jgi:CO/xanthine dehydrogenase FAD-binding subunit